MRPMLNSRARRASLALCGLACIMSATITSTAHAAASAPTTHPAIEAQVVDRHLTWGEAVTVTGRVHGADTAPIVTLQFRGHDGVWSTVGTTRAHHRAYRFHQTLPGRGDVRVTLGDGAQAVLASTGGTPLAPSTTGAHGVRVSAALFVRHKHLNLNGGRRVSLSGVVLPHRGGRLVVAQRRSGHRWITQARDRTDGNGHFKLAWRAGSGARVRVTASGDATVNAATSNVGRVNVMRDALASWYGDYGGPLACGGTLGSSQMGVANKSLPCGTMVTIAYRGRTVRVPVIDRGPYVGGREFDLTGATAHALGFDGVGTIQVSTR